ncbi:MAG: hypothetical protein AAEJ59_02370 [Arenicellales bacterium]
MTAKASRSHRMESTVEHDHRDIAPREHLVAQGARPTVRMWLLGARPRILVMPDDA